MSYFDDVIEPSILRGQTVSKKRENNRNIAIGGYQMEEIKIALWEREEDSTKFKHSKPVHIPEGTYWVNMYTNTISSEKTPIYTLSLKEAKPKNEGPAF